MKNTNDDVLNSIEKVLSSQRLAVLATERYGQPYSSLMAFANSADLTSIVVATGTATRKHINLIQEPRVSLLIDTRTNSEEDFHSAAAITVIGKAQIITENKYSEFEALYLGKHPYLETFLASPTTSLFRITVFHYLMVNRFQNVIEYHITDETDIFA